jgi:hypothetical protein
MYDTSLPGARAILTESGNITDVTCFELNDSSADSSHIALDHFGERPVSFRSLLKRYTTVNKVTFAADATLRKVFNTTQPIVPLPSPAYGALSNAFPTLLGYLRYAYVGLRGSVRYRVTGFGASGQDLLKTFRVVLDVPGTSTSTSSSISASSTRTTVTGGITMTPHSNPGLEIELPYYSPNLFQWSFSDDPVGDCVSGDMEPTWTRRFNTSISASLATDTFEMMFEIATGEDFNLFRFQGAPYYSI